MNQLSGTLTISSIYNVKSKEEAVEARLIDKQYLQALVLLWRDQPVPRVMNDDNGVAEAFLLVVNPESLPTLRMLELRKCIFLRSLSIPSLPSLEELRLTSLGVEVLTIFCGSTGGGRMLQQASSSIRRSNAISCLTSICLDNCDMLRNLDQFLSPEHLPSIKSIEIRLCRSLQSIPVGSFTELYHLQDLKISWCDNLVCEQAMVLPSSLRRLYINKCGGLDKSFPACLQNLTHLIALNLEYCNMESIPTGTNLQLKYLFLFGCSELSSIEGLHALSSMKYVYISQCTKLQQVEQPFKRSPPWSSPSTRRRLSGSSAKPDGHKDGGGGTLPSRGCPAAGDTGGFSAAADHRRWRPDGRRSGSAHAGCGSAFPGAKSSLPAVRSGLGDPNDGGPRGDGGKRRRTVVERWQAAEGWRDSRERPAGSWATAATATLLGPTRYGGVAQETHGDDGNSRQLAGGAVPAGWPAGDTARGRGATEAARGGGCMAERLMAMVATAGSQREE
ncbi:hypothetical protein OsI_18910 [Oryza sativa Indica Group]|uniref:R13L1/DRL21-like LRR repeat region domain-containing protein n=1 Tax=Oryza sativa subsp. indica TaxID=39946 RepID=B8AZ89_ORYSI|nr:hypothetical protein OsI_18910 [Oryza sativa Indica Group]